MTGQGDPALPHKDVRTTSSTTVNSQHGNTTAKVNEFPEEIFRQMKFLKDSNKVLGARIKHLLKENDMLKNENKG